MIYATLALILRILTRKKWKALIMQNDIKIDLFEDDKFKHKTGELKLCVADFAQLGIIMLAIRKAQNDMGIPCHFKITAQSLDYWQVKNH